AGREGATRALLQRAARVPRVRRVLSRARPALLLLQQPARRLPGVQRPWRRAPVRSSAHRAAPGDAPPRGALVDRAARAAAARVGPRGAGAPVSLPPGDPLPRPATG